MLEYLWASWIFHLRIFIVPNILVLIWRFIVCSCFRCFIKRFAYLVRSCSFKTIFWTFIWVFGSFIYILQLGLVFNDLCSIRLILDVNLLDILWGFCHLFYDEFLVGRRSYYFDNMLMRIIIFYDFTIHDRLCCYY